MLKRICFILAITVFAIMPLNVQAGKAENLLRIAILNESVEMVQEALRSGANVNYIQSDYTDNPLAMAVNTSNMAIIEVLLKNGANPNMQVEGNGLITSTPLLKAIAMQRLDIVKALVESGADINMPATRYYKPEETLFSPLMQAIASPYTRETMHIFNYILEKNADINYVSSEGETALMIAADGRASVYKQEAAYQMTETLLVKGAKKGLRNQRGKNATDIAVESNFVLMADLLRQKRFSNN